MFSIQIEGGQKHRTGLQIDITGTDGVLRITNPRAFENKDDNAIEGMKGDATTFSSLPIPDQYQPLASSGLDVSAQDLAYLCDVSAVHWLFQHLFKSLSGELPPLARSQASISHDFQNVTLYGCPWAISSNASRTNGARSGSGIRFAPVRGSRARCANLIPQRVFVCLRCQHKC